MTPFLWSEFRSRARTRLLVGLVLLVIGLGYGSWAGLRFGIRGADAVGFDRPIVNAARALAPAPFVTQTMRPTNNRELVMMGTVFGQHDTVVGFAVLLLRSIAALTVVGFGLVLLTAGSTEWEVRSEFARARRQPPSDGAALAPSLERAPEPTNAVLNPGAPEA